MLDIFKAYAVNLDAEVKGVWRNLPGSTTAKVLIARFGNDAYSKAVREKFEQHQADLSAGGDEADDLAKKLFLEIQVDTLILGWKGIGENGKELKYSREKAIELFGKPEMKNLLQKLLEMSMEEDKYLLHQEDEQEKN